MSKADQLGAGRFGNTQPVSARRQAVAAATGAATVGAPDSRLRTIPLEQLVPTRFNPRRNFGTDKDLLDFGLKLKKKQLQPAVAVTRGAYLRLWADESGTVGTARYVIANGERRYRASQAAGMGTLEVVIDDDIAKSRADFLDAVLSENNDREDLDPIERALGIQTMAEQLGGKGKVAEHYGKSGGWVTQQMWLLSLAPELQALVSSGELPVRETRSLVKLPHEEQLKAWQERAGERQEERERPRVRRSTDQQEQEPVELPPSGGFFTAVKNEPATETPEVGRPTPAPDRFTAVDHDGKAADSKPDKQLSAPAGQQPSPEQPSALPEPRSSAARIPAPPTPATRRLPAMGWDDMADALIEELPLEDRHQLTTKLLRVMTTEKSNRASA